MVTSTRGCPKCANAISPSATQERLQFENRGAAWGLDREGMSYGAAAGDLDGDGDVDLVVCNLTENVSL
jgi:hypothetical protein